MVLGGLVMYENVLNQFYECEGVKNKLIADENFWDIVHRFKIETTMPRVDPKLMMTYIMISHTITTHELNKIKKYVEEKRNLGPPKSEMKEPDMTIVDEIESNAKKSKTHTVKPPVVRRIGESV